MPIRGPSGFPLNTIRSPLAPIAPDAGGRARVTQQFVEIIEDGGSGNNAARVSQQFIEIIEDGAQGNNRARVTQQFVEIIHTFGTPPIIEKPKKTPPGQDKKNNPGSTSSPFDLYCNPTSIVCACIEEQRRARKASFLPWMDDEYVPPPLPDPIYVTKHFDVIIGDGGRRTITQRSY